MPPRKKPGPKLQSTQVTRRSTRQVNSSNVNHGVPQVYREMLADVPRESSDDFVASPRPAKRLRVSKAREETNDSLFDSPVASPEPDFVDVPVSDQKPQQIVFDDFEANDESDVEFEDVNLDHAEREAESEDEQSNQKPLQLDLSKHTEITPRKAVERRKPLTKAERELRLDVHKWHFMSLLLHQLSRNVWCENEQVHHILKPLIPRKVIALLHVDESEPSYQRNHSFTKGIEEVCTIWRREWTITARGLRRAYWDDSADALEAYDDAEDPIDFDDFKSAARTRRGSRDLGAQMFCALLRAVAVEARLVFSLQVLPYSGEVPQSYNSSHIKAKKKKIIDSPYPIFWVEIFNSVTTSWMPLDPIVRNTINKPKTQFEPPASDHLNSMSYVIAFEDDNTVRDVTRRYTQWFNAKTRRSRIENTKSGEEWLSKALGIFRRRMRLPRDEVEDDQLMQRAAAEGMPKNVQDFRQHPVYVLERHIRRNEVIHPRREVGKVTTGTAKNGKLESVFRRQDVYLCRSADGWYRRGRDVKIGEQPLKRVMPTIKRGARALSEEEENEEDREGVALYAEYQTQIYEPPPVVNGKIPKNAFGNLDVYVPSMIPAGAVHVMHPLASQAAKLLGLDSTAAVTGFDFKGRQGTAVINGCVIASEYTAALTTTIESLEWQGTKEVQAERSRLTLALWKRMLTALRIRERIEQDYGEKHNSDSDSDDSTYSETKVQDDGGGFMLEADETAEKANEQIASLQSMKNRLPVALPQEVTHQPIKIAKSPHRLPEPEQTSNDDLFENDSDTRQAGEEGGFPMHEDQFDGGGGGGGFMPADDNEDQDLRGVGFIAEDEDPDTNVAGGGFLPEPDSGRASTGASGHEGFTPDHAKRNQLAHQLHNEASQTHTINQSSRDTIHAQATTSHAEPPVLTDTTTKPSDSDLNPNPEDVDHLSETSLLSHDPEEDNDENPEWLAEAMEE